jgi:hypothetical protein
VSEQRGPAWACSWPAAGTHQVGGSVAQHRARPVGVAVEAAVLGLRPDS